MAAERLILGVACALVVLGALSVPAVQGTDEVDTNTPTSGVGAAPGAPAPSTQVTGAPVTAGASAPTASDAPPRTTAKTQPKAVGDPCAGATKHPPMHADAEFRDFRRHKSPRRVLATGSYGETSWRLAIERDDTYDRWNLAFAHTSDSGGGGSATSPDGPPLFISGSSLDDGWAYLGKAANDTACLVVTTNKGARVATKEFFRDDTFDDGVFFIAFVSCLDGARGAVVETFDRAGTRTAQAPTDGYPTREDFGGSTDVPATPEEWCTR